MCVVQYSNFNTHSERVKVVMTVYTTTSLHYMCTVPSIKSKFYDNSNVYNLRMHTGRPTCTSSADLAQYSRATMWEVDSIPVWTEGTPYTTYYIIISK